MQDQSVPFTESAKKHIREPATWMRVLFMLIFAIIYGIVEFVLMGAVILQIILRLLTGKLNKRLRQFSGDLSQYVYDILRFLTFNSEAKPFPFSDWKQAEPADDGGMEEA